MSYVFSKQTCAVSWRGSRVDLFEGDAWHASDPFVKDRPEFFADSPTVVRGTRSAEQLAETEQPVEQATRAPGEKRTTRRSPRG